MKILLLDNDDCNIKTLTSYFQSFSCEIIVTSNCIDAVNNLEIAKPNLCFASLKLVKNNNWDFLSRAKESLMPIIGLVRKDHSLWMKEGLTRGINAYLVTPFDLLHLKTYLPSVFNQVWAVKKRLSSSANERRCHSDRRILVEGRRWYDRLIQIANFENENKEESVKIGPFSICNEKKCVIRDGENIKLSPKEYKLFSLLFRNMDQVVSTDTIISHTWDLNSRATEEDVKQYIYMLRKKIEKNPSQPSIILNHKGFGYMFSSNELI